MTTERYWRVNDSSFWNHDVTLGLQMANEDVATAIIPDIKRELWDVLARAAYSLKDFERIAIEIQAAVKARWPGRYYFIEVGNDADYWVQIFHPMTEFRKAYDASNR